MSRARLVITAVVIEGRRPAEVAAAYGVSKGWVSKLLARYRDEGEAAFEPRSRRPHTSPTATPAAVVARIVELRDDLARNGHDAGPDTIVWKLAREGITVSAATVARKLTAADRITSQPHKRPKSSYVRFQAKAPNETWQADFTHYRLADATEVEILTWLDDHSRYALSVTAHRRVTGPIVLATFRRTVACHGIPASTLTDNGMVFTTRFAGGRGGRAALEHVNRPGIDGGSEATGGQESWQHRGSSRMRYGTALSAWCSTSRKRPGACPGRAAGSVSSSGSTLTRCVAG